MLKDQKGGYFLRKVISRWSTFLQIKKRWKTSKKEETIELNPRNSGEYLIEAYGVYQARARDEISKEWWKADNQWEKYQVILMESDKINFHISENSY